MRRNERFTEKIGPPAMTLSGVGLVIFGAVRLIIEMSNNLMPKIISPEVLMTLGGAFLGMIGATLWDKAGHRKKK